jgi:tyrosyl-tRNA synthetase
VQGRGHGAGHSSPHREVVEAGQGLNADVSTPEQQMHVIESGTAAIVPKDALLEKLRSGRSLRIKLGVDPTAPDLHLGHAVPLRKLRQFQDLGHTVVLIIGDFTAFIGDPSGRNTTRPPLTVEQIDEHAQTYIAQAFKILDPERTELVRNSTWLGALTFADLLRLTSQFTVARILEREDFRKRYTEQRPISLHEFLYPVAQAYDSVEVKADVEIGGTDQLFNLLAGRDLMEKSGMEPQVCLTLPLLEGTDGVQKMSKSYGNYIGLTDEPDDMFGKVMSIPDELMVKYFRLCTPLGVDEIDALESSLSAGTVHPNQLKRRLGREIVALYHGPEAAGPAEAAFDRVFKRGDVPAKVPELVIERVEPLHLPALLCQAGMASSTSEGRRLVDGGAVKLDGAAVGPGAYDVAFDDAAGRVLQAGKRRFVRLVARS